MTINTQKLSELVTFDFELPVSVRDAVDAACDHIDAQTAEIARLREALQVVHGHINMSALEISHCKDATMIRAALSGESNV